MTILECKDIKELIFEHLPLIHETFSAFIYFMSDEYMMRRFEPLTKSDIVTIREKSFMLTEDFQYDLHAVISFYRSFVKIFGLHRAIQFVFERVSDVFPIGTNSSSPNTHITFKTCVCQQTWTPMYHWPLFVERPDSLYIDTFEVFFDEIVRYELTQRTGIPLQACLNIERQNTTSNHAYRFTFKWDLDENEFALIQYEFNAVDKIHPVLIREERRSTRFT